MPAADTDLARAKINLALHVTGRRPDGYHLLDSLVVFADIGDRLSVTERDGESEALILEGPFAGDLARAGDPADNLVSRAIALLAAHSSSELARPLIRLDKRLPVASGIGGGSADAAATLRLLNRFWHLGRPTGDLAAIGLSLGADVPVCVHSVACRMSGIGEIVAPVTGLPPLPLVLVNPGAAVSTAAAFARLASRDNPLLPALPGRFRDVAAVAGWLQATRNDLEAPATALLPTIGVALTALRNAPDCLLARMSGSGATAFGVFPSPAAAAEAAARIAAAEPGWWVAATTAESEDRAEPEPA